MSEDDARALALEQAHRALEATLAAVDEVLDRVVERTGPARASDQAGDWSEDPPGERAIPTDGDSEDVAVASVIVELRMLDVLHRTARAGGTVPRSLLEFLR